MKTSNKREVTSRLMEAIECPLGADFPKLGSAFVCMLSEQLKVSSSLYSITTNGFRFSVRGIAFRLALGLKPTVILEFRHMEAIKWQNAKINNRKKDRLAEITSRIAHHAITKAATPFE